MKDTQVKYVFFIFSSLALVLGACDTNRHPDAKSISQQRSITRSLSAIDTIKAGNMCYSDSLLFLSNEFNDPPYKLLNTRLVMVLEMRENTGKSKWYRILCSDGQLGWTQNMKGLALPASVKGFNFSLNPKSPDDSDFLSSNSFNHEFVNEKTGLITGASQYTPENSEDEYPWLKIKIDSLNGWCPPVKLDFYWNYIVDSTKAQGQPIADRFGLTGIIRKPFLGVLNAWIEDTKPKLQSPVYYAKMNNNSETLRKTRLTIGLPLRKIDCVINDPDSNKDAFSTSIVYADSPSSAQEETKKVFTFLNQNGDSRHVVFSSHESTVVDYKKTALDNDNLNEWMVEELFTYPDGRYSTLMIVNGSMKDEFVVCYLDLGGSCGEPGCDNNVSSFWWVDKFDDNTARVFRIYSYQDKVSIEIALFGYSRNSGLKEIKYKKIYAVLLGESDDNLQAQKLSVSISKKINYNNLHVFPRNENSHIKWSVGRIFEKQQDAQSWLESVKPLHEKVKMVELANNSNKK